MQPTADSASVAGTGQPGNPLCSTVLFDGSCPMCRAEVALYRQQTAASPIHWVDVSSEGFVAVPGKTRDEVMKRFHIIRPDGVVISGALAFGYLWTQIPGWQWLGRVAQKPVVLPMLEWAYNGFLLFRPTMQVVWRWVARRFGKTSGTAADKSQG